MNKNERAKGSHITLENPITNEDLHKKLFQNITLYDYKSKENIFLHTSSKHEHNRRIYFSNVDKEDKTGSILVGKYKYYNFWTPTESALAFAQTITNRIKEIEKNVDGS